jgi:hypothetical protein
MLQNPRWDFIHPANRHPFSEVLSFAKFAAVWLLVSFAVTALVWVTYTYGGLAQAGDAAAHYPGSVPGAG